MDRFLPINPTGNNVVLILAHLWEGMIFGFILIMYWRKKKNKGNDGTYYY